MGLRRGPQRVESPTEARALFTPSVIEIGGVYRLAYLRPPIATTSPPAPTPGTAPGSNPLSPLNASGVR
ncbi:hypothetical protein LBMAG42_03380 [Deltaproteobacteria bacterium]|nr:hypothetical protein LBMAG42_03380 [Deltaproteobacteria bacterium]